jgi:hypothetical protein
MNTFISTTLAHALLAATLLAQNNIGTAPNAEGTSRDQTSSSQTSLSKQTSEGNSDVENLRRDTERLRVLLNQMRSNLAFVQSSQTPLKHQFELEADAWQVIVNDMDRRLKRMEEQKRTEGQRN